MRTFAVLLALLAFIGASCGYYLPGVTAKNYKEGDEVKLTVNALSSSHSVIPYSYSYEKFGFCVPDGGFKPDRSNLGSVLFGDRVYNSAFNLTMLKNSTCVHLCTKELEKDKVNFLIERIQEKYYLNWFVDSLPAARRTTDKDRGQSFLSVGFELGTKDESAPNNKEAKPQMHNHYVIIVEVFSSEGDVHNVVGVVVYGFSKAYTLNAKNQSNCDSANVPPLILSHDDPTSITYTYEVRWQPSDIPWATRWDNYLHTYNPKIHWFSLVNSFVIVLFLTFMVGMILLRALHKDISRYNQDSQEEAQEEYGWKLVHGDVFRTPSHPLLLSVFVGNGVQFFLMTCVTLALALLGFLSPSIRGSLMTVAIAFYVCFGFAAGYTSARIYKMFGGEAWKRCVVLTATLIPGMLSGILLTLNFFLVANNSSAAVPFGTLAGLLGLWMLISCPLCFVGAYLAFKKPKAEYPVRINQIPRQIPPQAYYLQRLPSILLGGILPFGAIFIELYFIMNSIWYNRIYYVFGFLFMVFLILTLTCSEVTVLMCYFHLCTEDYRWWWRAFFTSGCSALYVFLYCLLYFVYGLQMDNFVSLVLYFGWVSVMCIIFFILTGTVGFLSSLWFVRKIYAAIKID